MFDDLKITGTEIEAAEQAVINATRWHRQIQVEKEMGPGPAADALDQCLLKLDKLLLDRHLTETAEKAVRCGLSHESFIVRARDVFDEAYAAKHKEPDRDGHLGATREEAPGLFPAFPAALQTEYATGPLPLQDPEES